MAQLTAQGISQLAIGLLARQIVLPATASLVDGGDYDGPNGGTITVRVPQPATAREQVNGGDTITWDDLTEVPVSLAVKHLYHATRVTDQNLTYGLRNFGQQITMPQVTAVATKAEDQVATVINSRAVDLNVAPDGSDVDAVILAARTALTRNLVPFGDRYLAVSPEFGEFLLAQDNMKSVADSGNSSALRDAVIGRYRGFTVVESAGLTAGQAAAYHRSGIVWTTLRPVTPQGATASATHSQGGITMRQIFHYNPLILSEQSVVSTFAGAALVAEDGTGTNGTIFKRIIKLGTSAS